MTTIHCKTLILALTLTLGAAAGCKKKDDSGEESTAAKAVAAKPIDVGAINSAVPSTVPGLSFTTATLTDDNIEAVVPAGWEGSKVIPGRYRPAQGSDLGFFTDYAVGSNCDGACQPKEWKPVVDKVEFGRLGDATIVKDEPLPNGRIVIAKSDDRTEVIAAWWKEGASHYAFCRATLDGKTADAVDAFEQACRATRVTNW